MPKIKIYIGLIFLVLISSGVYITWPEQGLKMRIDEDRSTFYLYDDRYWRVSGRELNSLWSGTTKINRDLSTVYVNTTFDLDTNETIIIRFTKYRRGPVIVDTYKFDGKNTDIELFPVDHTIEIYNASGYIYQYEVRDLKYDGETIKGVTSPQTFGRMKITFTDGYYWTTLYKSGILKVRYRVTEDYLKLDNRLFDPPSAVVHLYTGGIINTPAYIESGTTINITAYVDPPNQTVCLTVYYPGLGTNFLCGTGSVQYDWTALGGHNQFADNSFSANFSFNETGQTIYKNLPNISSQSKFIGGSLDINGYYGNDSYPRFIKIDIGSDGTYDYVTSGELKNDIFEICRFNDSINESSCSEYNFTYTSDDDLFIKYVKVPKEVIYKNATLKLKSILSDYQSSSYEMYDRIIKTRISDMTRYGSTDLFYHFSGSGGPTNGYFYYNSTSGSFTDITTADIDSPNSMFYVDSFIVKGDDDTKTYNVSTSSWSSLTPNSKKIRGDKCLIDRDNDTIYCIGGNYYIHAADYSDTLGDIWIYNITDDSWSQGASLNENKTDHFIEWLDNDTILIYGGRITTPSHGEVNLTTQLYNITSDTVTSYSSNANLYNYYYLSGAKINNIIYGFGGAANNTAVYYWDISTNTWTFTGTTLSTTVYSAHCSEFDESVLCMHVYGFYGDFRVQTIKLLKTTLGFLVDSYESYNEISYDFSTQDYAEIDFTEALQNQTDECIVESDGYCYIPLYFYNLEGGNIQLKELNITINTTEYTIDSSAFVNGDLNLSVYNNGKGVVNISNINISYIGDSLELWIATSSGDYIPDSDSQNVYIRYSNYTKTLPYTWSDTIFFLPKIFNETEIDPWYQTISQGIVTLTGTAQESSINYAVKTDEYDECVSIFINDVYNYSNSTLLNSSYQTIATNIGKTNSKEFWMWADLNYTGGYIANDDLVSHYKLDLDATDSAGSNDGSKYGNISGTINSATWTTDCKYDDCLNFDGVDDYVNVTDITISNESGTICAWAKANEIGVVGYGYIVSHYKSGNRIYINQQDSYFRIRLGSGAIMTLGSMTTDWVHGCMTWNSTDVIGFYNGNNVITQAQVGLTNINNYLEIGKLMTAASWFNGSIDSVRIWDKALSQSEIQAEMISSLPVETDGLIAAMELDEGTGTTTYSVPYTSGQIGEAMWFDGVDDYMIAIGTETITDDGTISLWFKVNEMTDGDRLFQKGSGVRPALLYVGATNNIRFQAYNGSAHSIANATTTLENDTWIFVAATWEKDNKVKLYYNGVLEGDATLFGSIQEQANPYVFGRRGNQDDDYFNGTIDDVRIYSDVLTADEIERMYLNGRDGCNDPPRYIIPEMTWDSCCYGCVDCW